MKKRFAVLVGEPPEGAETKFKEWIDKHGLGWWHWMSGSWLLSNPMGNLTASEVRDAVGSCYGTANCMVLELTGNSDTWSGFGPKNDTQDMFKWVRNNWSGE